MLMTAKATPPMAPNNTALSARQPDLRSLFDIMLDSKWWTGVGDSRGASSTFGWRPPYQLRHRLRLCPPREFSASEVDVLGELVIFQRVARRRYIPAASTDQGALAL